MSSHFITAPQVAAILGYAHPESFHRARHQLEQKEGFPKPAIDGAGLRKKWDPQAIEAWRQARIPAHLRTKLPADTPHNQLAIEAELASRAKKIGARLGESHA